MKNVVLVRTYAVYTLLYASLYRSKMKRKLQNNFRDFSIRNVKWQNDENYEI